MKPFLLLLSLLISVPVFSQHYRTVLTDSEVYFDFKDGMHSRVILTDSFQVINNDTIIYHEFNQEFEVKSIFDTTFQMYMDCYNLSDTGFLSHQTILQNDGTDVFFNRFHDSIFIQTQSNLNDTWIFFQQTNGNYFEATVTNIDTSHFLGIFDSTKTITLQAKDSLGNNISSFYDALNIKISKHYGIVEGFNFFAFPHGISNEIFGSWVGIYNKIQILGFPNYNLGVDNLTAAKVYDYNIGDEYHWETLHGAPYGQGDGSHHKVYDIITVTDKQFSANGDSVYYDVYLKKYNVIINSQGLIHSFDTLYVGDTLLTYYIGNDSPINTLPLHNDTKTTWGQTVDGNQKIPNPEKGIGLISNGCVIPETEIRNEFGSIYHKGVGLTYYQHGIIIFLEKRSILYYNKNGNIYGTPLNIDSLSTVSTDEIAKNDFEINLKVFPNPTNNLLNFQFTEPIDNAEIRIYSSIGQLVGQTALPLPQTNIQFNVSDWSKGVYFYGIYVEGEVVKQGQVLVKN